MMEKARVSRWMAFAAVLMFAAATFQIADGMWFPGVIFFAAAVTFSAAAAKYRSE